MGACVCVCIHSIWSHDMFNLLNRVVNVSYFDAFFLLHFTFAFALDTLVTSHGQCNGRYKTLYLFVQNNNNNQKFKIELTLNSYIRKIYQYTYTQRNAEHLFVFVSTIFLIGSKQEIFVFNLENSRKKEVTDFTYSQTSYSNFSSVTLKISTVARKQIIMKYITNCNTAL